MGRQRRFLAVMTVLALAGAALQAATGDAQFVLHFTPLFLLGGLLLAGRYVGEDRIVARWRAAVVRAARPAGARPLAAAGERALARARALAAPLRGPPAALAPAA